MEWLYERRSRLLALVSLAGIIAGGVLALSGNTSAADVAWAATIVVMLVPLTWEVARALLRGDIGVDVIALLAMASALAAGEQLAGALVAPMLSGGNALEDYAAGRARRRLTAPLQRGRDGAARARAAGRPAPPARRGRRSPSTRSRPATSCSCGRARSSRWTAPSRTTRPSSTSPR